MKLLTQDAVISTKLLYGLESAELKDSDKNKLDVFQLKGLRNILKNDTTFVNRQNTNAKFVEEANMELDP